MSHTFASESSIAFKTDGIILPEINDEKKTAKKNIIRNAKAKAKNETLIYVKHRRFTSFGSCAQVHVIKCVRTQMFVMFPPSTVEQARKMFVPSL